MRVKLYTLWACACGLALALPLDEAHAESFFQKLFGWGRPAASEPATNPKPVPSLGSFSRSSGSRDPSYENANADQFGDEPGGAYKTLCVRTCDGYYFPISSQVSSRRFSRDARQCKTMCGQEAKLFHLPKGSDDIKDMTDVDGHTYNSLPQAFAYRRSLTNGCACKPMPWSATEAARHGHYALVETIEKAQARNSEQAAAVAAERGDAETLAAMTRAADSLSVAHAALANPQQSASVDAALPAFSTASAGAPPDEAMLGHLLPESFEQAVAEEAGVSTASLGQRVRKPSNARKIALARVKPAPSFQFFSLIKYSWPGDAPNRRR